MNKENIPIHTCTHDPCPTQDNGMLHVPTDGFIIKENNYEVYIDLGSENDTL